MMRIATLTAAVLLLATPVAHGAPVTIVLDDFSTAQGPLVDLSANGVPVTDVTGGRTLSINGLSFLNPPSNRAEIVAGRLVIENGAGDDSEVIRSFAIPANLVPAGATATTLVFESASTLTGDVELEILLGVASLGSHLIPAGANNADSALAVDAATINAGGTLTFRINGQPGSEFSLGGINLTFEAAAVPVPATFGLATMGLLAAFGARRVCSNG